MKKSLIAMTSITYAMKAKNLLNSLKYYCEIQRTPKDLGTGCGYSIAVTAPPEDTHPWCRFSPNNQCESHPTIVCSAL